MSWIRTGTVTVTNNSPNVVGSGTVWSQTVNAGDTFLGPDREIYEVLSVNTDTSITLATNYLGSTTSGGAYAIYPTQDAVRVAANTLRDLLQALSLPTMAVAGPTSDTDRLLISQGGVSRAIALSTLETTFSAGSPFIKATDPPWNARFNGSVDDTAAIQACINANPGRTIVGGTGSAVVSGTLLVTSDGTVLQDMKLLQVTPNIDTVVFRPTTAGVTAAFLNNPAAIRVRVTNLASAWTGATSGAGIRFVQCNEYRLHQCVVNDAIEGITVMGGQFGSLKTFSVFAANGTYAGDGTALLHFRQAPYGTGLFQPCYTVEVDDFRLSATLLRDACIRVSNGDGVTFANGYPANGKNSLLLLQAERDFSTIASLDFTKVYFDCVGAGKTPNGISIPDDGFANSEVFHVTIGSGCTIGNGDGVGILSRKAKLGDLSVDGARIINMGSWAVDVWGGTGTDIRLQNSRFSNTGSPSTGSVRINGCRSYIASGNTWALTESVVMNLTGSITRASITSNINTTNIDDLVNTATMGSPVQLAGNASFYSGANSWLWYKTSASLDFGSLAPGAQQTLTISLPGAAVTDNVAGNVNGASNVMDVGGGALFAFFFGVSAANTVSVRAVNIGTAAGDPGPLTFWVQILR